MIKKRMIKDMVINNRSQIKQMIGIIAAFGIIAAVFEIIFAKKIIYSLLGLLIGCLLAVYMLVYMNMILEKSMGFEAKAVERYIVKHSVIRYFSIVIVFGAVCITNIADPIACFIGLIGLKISAYLQPVVSRLIDKRKSL